MHLANTQLKEIRILVAIYKNERILIVVQLVTGSMVYRHEHKCLFQHEHEALDIGLAQNLEMETWLHVCIYLDYLDI